MDQDSCSFVSLLFADCVGSRRTVSSLLARISLVDDLKADIVQLPILSAEQAVWAYYDLYLVWPQLSPCGPNHRFYVSRAVEVSLFDLDQDYEPIPNSDACI